MTALFQAVPFDFLHGNFRLSQHAKCTHPIERVVLTDLAHGGPKDQHRHHHEPERQDCFHEDQFPDAVKLEKEDCCNKTTADLGRSLGAE
jgi:hypothetical protein